MGGLVYEIDLSENSLRSKLLLSDSLELL